MNVAPVKIWETEGQPSGEPEDKAKVVSSKHRKRVRLASSKLDGCPQDMHIHEK